MKKSVAAIALTASSSAFALMAPPQAQKTICLDTYQAADGSKVAGTCDQSRNNAALGKRLQENNCARGQVALSASMYADEWYPKINYCLPPNVAQL